MKTTRMISADELALMIAEMRRIGGPAVEGQSDEYLADLLGVTRYNVEHAMAEAKAAFEFLTGQIGA